MGEYARLNPTCVKPDLKHDYGKGFITIPSLAAVDEAAAAAAAPKEKEKGVDELKETEMAAAGAAAKQEGSGDRGDSRQEKQGEDDAEKQVNAEQAGSNDQAGGSESILI